MCAQRKKSYLWPLEQRMRCLVVNASSLPSAPGMQDEDRDSYRWLIQVVSNKKTVSRTSGNVYTRRTLFNNWHTFWVQVFKSVTSLFKIAWQELNNTQWRDFNNSIKYIRQVRSLTDLCNQCQSCLSHMKGTVAIDSQCLLQLSCVTSLLCKHNDTPTIFFTFSSFPSAPAIIRINFEHSSKKYLTLALTTIFSTSSTQISSIKNPFRFFTTNLYRSF